jgi:Arc/MetJ family transcription regulator
MQTNIDIDDKLMKEAMKISKVKSKKDLVNHALEELIVCIKEKNVIPFWKSEMGRKSW